MPFDDQAVALGGALRSFSCFLEFACAQFAFLLAALGCIRDLLAQRQVDVVSGEINDLVGVVLFIGGTPVNSTVFQAKGQGECASVGDYPTRPGEDDRRSAADSLVGNKDSLKNAASILDFADIKNESVELIIENPGLKPGAGAAGGNLEYLCSKRRIAGGAGMERQIAGDQAGQYGQHKDGLEHAVEAGAGRL